MARKSARLSLALLLFLAARGRAAMAGTPDPSTLRDQLEEQVLDGDHDADDLAVFHLPAHSLGLTRRGGSSYVSLVGFGGQREDGQHEVGGVVILGIPLERFARGSSPIAAAAPVHESAPAEWDKPNDSEPSRLPLLLEDASPSAKRAPVDPIVVTPDVARSCVRAAWRVLGVADDGRLDSMVARARSSAALPELRLRAMRTADTSGRVTLTDVDPGRYTEAGTATNWLEARLTFRLDRLLFADEEVSIERVRLDRSEVRARTSAKVLQALFEWQRAYALVLDAPSTSAEHFAAVLRELEASAILDVMTDGWFGRFRLSLGSRSP